MTYKRILVPVDGSSTSNAGLREAIRLAQGQGAALQLVHVADQHFITTMGMESAMVVDDLLADVVKAGKRILHNAEQVVRKAGLEPTSVMLETLTGPAADPIVRQAKKWNADLIVIGTHGRTGIARFVLGSVASRVVSHAACPVLTVRGK